MARFPEVGDQFGRYTIEAMLGRGAMGVVFQATDTTLRRSVALKVLTPTLSHDAEFRDRFAREAGVLARLDSPHIVQIYEYGEIDGCLYLSTQLVSGGDLHAHLARSGSLSREQAIDLVSQICVALTDAHEAGVIHRDLKPSNVLVRQRGRRLHAYLCDFGIALAEDSGFTRTGIVIGSLAYMAPERHEGARADERSDLYSLGCLLYGVLTGVPPYEGTDIQVAIAHLSKPVPQLAGDDPLTLKLNGVLRRAMAKKPAERYASAEDFLADLERPATSGPAPRTLELPIDPAPSPEPTGQVEVATEAASATQAPESAPELTVRRATPLADAVPPPTDATVVRAQRPVVPQAAQPSTRSVLPPPLDVEERLPAPRPARRTAVTPGFRHRRVLGAALVVIALLVGAGVVAMAWPGASAAFALTAGTEHTCGVRPDYTAACWGKNTSGQLGNGRLNGVSGPVELPGTWTRLTVGYSHTCGIRTDKTAACWGNNSNGQLGVGAVRTATDDPTDLPGTWTTLTAGYSHTCGIRTDNTAACWGDNDSGQLGNGTTDDTSRPRNLTGTWTTLTAGSRHTCGIRTDNTAACWGNNKSGQLGNGSFSDFSGPADLPGTWTTLTAGFSHTCGIRTDNTAACWGNNESGRLGNGTTKATSRPADLPGTWTTLTAGSSHTCGIRTDNTAACWGNNESGRLGNGTTNDTSRPADLPGTWTTLTAGYRHTCGTPADDSATCWGNNSSGQLGLSGASALREPTRVDF